MSLQCDDPLRMQLPDFDSRQRDPNVVVGLSVGNGPVSQQLIAGVPSGGRSGRPSSEERGNRTGRAPSYRDLSG